MALTKVSYADNETVISAQNLNDIQDAILALEAGGGGTSTPIQKSDLASDVQASLGKADTAVQSVSGKGLSDQNYTLAEKNKLSGIEAGAQANTITGVKGDAESSYRTGNINITKGNIGLGNVENKSSSTIRSEITKQNITNALGYTPADSASSSGNEYTTMTASEAKTGTATTPRVITASVLNAAIENKGYTTNTGTITGITMNGESKGTSGVVNLGTVLTEHQNISGKANITETVSNVAYDSTNKKLTKTINGSTSDVVTVTALKTALSLTKGDVGLGNVDNTSDANKPVSNAMLTALNNKVDKAEGMGLSTNDYTNADQTKVSNIKNMAYIEYVVTGIA